MTLQEYINYIGHAQEAALDGRTKSSLAEV